MANDIGAILAALASGAQPGSGSNSGRSDEGLNRVMGVTLRLIADPGNAAAAKELTDQVSSAAHKAFQEMDELRGKVRAKTSEWAASVGHTMSSAWQQQSSAHTQATGRIAAELEETHAGKRQAPADHHRVRPGSRTVHSERARNSKRSEETASDDGRAEQFEKRADELGEVGSHLIELAERVAVLNAPDEKTAEQRKNAFKSVKNVFGVADDSWKIAKGAGKVFKSFSAPATLQKTGAGIVGMAARGAGAAETASTVEGLVGAATASGTEALAGTGAIAAVAGVVGAGIAVHDILAKLTGKFETLTGVVGDWVETTRRNAELEKSIERQQRAREWETERLKQQAEQTQNYFGGRARIEEAQDRQRAVTRYGSRVADVAYGTLFDRMRVGTKGEQELQARAEESAQRRAEQREYEQERALALGRYLTGHAELGETVLVNKQRAELAKRGIVPLKLGEFQKRFPTEAERVAHQKEIDVAESAVVPGNGWEGFKHGFKQVWLGAGSTTMSFERAKTEQELAKVMNLSPVGEMPEDIENAKRMLGRAGNSPKEIDRYIQGKLEQEGIDPHSSVMGASGEPAKPDMPKQLALEAEQVKLAQHLYDLTQKRQDALLSELATMRQQIQASREKVAAAKEGVRVAQQQSDEQKAGFAVSMSLADQRIAAGILNEMKSGKDVSREKLMYLEQRGVVTGRIGAHIHAQLAKTLDPGCAKALKDWGIDEELGKKEKELAAATSDLKDRFKEFEGTLKETIGNLFVLGLAGAAGGKTTKQAEQSGAHVGGYPDPNESQARVNAIKEEGKGFVDALDEMEEATIGAIRAASAKGREAAQRIKQAHE
jgi:hypothetical protein